MIYGLQNQKFSNTSHQFWENGKGNYCFKKESKKKFKISRLDEPEPSVQSMHAEPGQCKYNMYLSELVGNKAKGRISEWVFQEKEARQIFGKTNISYTLIRIRTFSGGREKMHWEQMG